MEEGSSQDKNNCENLRVTILGHLAINSITSINAYSPSLISKTKSKPPKTGSPVKKQSK
jgi:hypothetical protein